MACTAVMSHFIWEMGRQATWSGFGGGEAMTLGVRGSRPLMVAGGPKRSQIPSSPMRRRACSGQLAWVGLGGQAHKEAAVCLCLESGNRHHVI